MVILWYGQSLFQYIESVYEFVDDAFRKSIDVLFLPTNKINVYSKIAVGIRKTQMMYFLVCL